MRQFFYLLLLIPVFILPSCQQDHIAPLAPEQQSLQVVQQAGKLIPNSYLIQFKADIPELMEADARIKPRTVRPEPGASQNARMASSPTYRVGQRLLQDYKVENVRIEKSFSIPGSHTIAVSGTEEDMKKLLADKRVRSIEPNQVIDLNIYVESDKDIIDPNDPVVSAHGKSRLIPSGAMEPINDIFQITPWGVRRVGGSTDMSGSANVVYILDSGVDKDHPDLNINQSLSINFTSNRSKKFDDDFGHGTHVAGIIGAKDNSAGVVGVAAGVPIVAVKVLDQNGTGSLSSFLDGLNYVLNTAVSGDVINLSLGADSTAILDNAVKNIKNSLGVQIVISAGNESDNTINYSPARLDEAGVFVTCASNSFDLFCNFSNYGDNTYHIAPGNNIYSTWLDGTYRIMSGTSMAAPHLAGVLMVSGGQLKATETLVALPNGKHAKVVALP